MLLAVLGLFIGFFALVGFWIVRKDTLDTASSRTDELVEKQLPEKLKEYLSFDEGKNTLKDLVDKGIASAIIDDKETLSKIADALRPILKKNRQEYRSFEENIGTRDIEDSEIEQLLQEMIRKEKDGENG